MFLVVTVVQYIRSHSLDSDHDATGCTRRRLCIMNDLLRCTHTIISIEKGTLDVMQWLGVNCFATFSTWDCSMVLRICNRGVKSVIIDLVSKLNDSPIKVL